MPSLSLLLAIVDTVSVLFLGDIMQHRQQLHSALIPGSDTLQSASYDYSSYFRHIQPMIDAADFTVANMEFCLGGPPYTGYPSFSAPESLAEEAADAGVDLFLCANNHICDRGRRGLASSIDRYEALGVPFTGIYRDSLSEASANPFITDIGGARVAFVNFTYGTNGVSVPPPFIVNKMESGAVREAIRRAQEAGADIIIALPHWGPEYVTEPSVRQKEWAGRLLEWGADVVIGTHPHVVQRAKLPVVYSLGNLISNMSRRDTELGLAYRLDIAVTFWGLAYVAGGEALPLWCSRPGGYGEQYTVLPVKEFLDRKEEFLGSWNYDRMIETYNRLKPLFEQ